MGWRDWRASRYASGGSYLCGTLWFDLLGGLGGGWVGGNSPRSFFFAMRGATAAGRSYAHGCLLGMKVSLPSSSLDGSFQGGGIGGGWTRYFSLAPYRLRDAKSFFLLLLFARGHANLSLCPFVHGLT
ncbi:hypothetical protein EJ03DRAFT_100069 [Teratosphaeria nubilosa]|uniref:Uncharacterized protein n=1 Tax=Teratosphaeria nubilosa TaxID=161662 RepID=A0A6G1LAG2_9PEZI|nr:hypothetical protein EJ03DRAFT_100069 [Teratosphaeria nubilosa]